MKTEKITLVEFLRIIRKAFAVSLRVRSPLSLVIGLTGFIMAFWPVLTSRKLALLTDGVVALTEKTGDLNNVIWIFGSLALMLLSQAVYTAVENYLSQIDLEKTTRYIRQTIIRHGCRVKYKYIENYDDFKQKVDFAKPKPDKGLAKAYSRYCPFYRG